MITIFTIPKPFRGHNAIIQQNAIRSWALLHPKCEIILFGDEEGIAEAAAEMNVRNIPAIARNEYGTPLVSDAFEQAARSSTEDILCYINSDIILCNDFSYGIYRISNKKRKFLMVGQRWDIEIDKLIDFDKNWELQVRNLVKDCGILHPRCGIDYFAFPKGLFKEIPPFAIGRPGWDNWMIYQALSSGYPVIDLTKAVTAIHQNHDYSHVPQKRGSRYEGPEGEQNTILAGGSSKMRTIDDANYVLRGEYIFPTIIRRIKKPIILAISCTMNFINRKLARHKISSSSDKK